MADGSGRLVFDTQELSPNEFSNVGECNKKAGIIAFYPGRENPLSQEEIEVLESAAAGGLSTKKKAAKSNSKSKRLRAVFYRMWEQDDEGFKSADVHYDFWMEKLINHFKGMLDEDEE